MMPVMQPAAPLPDARVVPAMRGFGTIALIGALAFLTVVDLFATQAILPALTAAYATTPATMSLVVNASTLGMALAGLALSVIGRRIPRRLGIVASLLVLSLPTLALAGMPPLATFAALRVMQGLCMASAFTLTLAYIGENSPPRIAASAFAAYITGNVASNLFGRLLSAAVADHFGLASNFHAFAALNLCGALLALAYVRTTPMTAAATGMSRAVGAWRTTLRSPTMRAAFALGFCILFAFIGTFTYVNFVLVRQPFGLGMMALGLVYCVFAPSILTTPLAGSSVLRWGTQRTCLGALALAMLGLPLLLLPWLAAVLAGMVLLSVGTFFAQAVATGFVGREAPTDRAAASGLYLASYFFGGLLGSFLLGAIYDRFGWPACVIGIGAVLAAGMLLACRLAGRRISDTGR